VDVRGLVARGVRHVRRRRRSRHRTAGPGVGGGRRHGSASAPWPWMRQWSCCGAWDHVSTVESEAMTLYVYWQERLRLGGYTGQDAAFRALEDAWPRCAGISARRASHGATSTGCSGCTPVARSRSAMMRRACPCRAQRVDRRHLPLHHAARPGRPASYGVSGHTWVSVAELAPRGPVPFHRAVRPERGSGFPSFLRPGAALRTRPAEAGMVYAHDLRPCRAVLSPGRPAMAPRRAAAGQPAHARRQHDAMIETQDAGGRMVTCGAECSRGNTHQRR
jgi:hypothetical protein